jgi:hypothetical protein
MLEQIHRMLREAEFFTADIIQKMIGISLEPPVFVSPEILDLSTGFRYNQNCFPEAKNCSAKTMNSRV